MSRLESIRSQAADLTRARIPAPPIDGCSDALLLWLQLFHLSDDTLASDQEKRCLRSWMDELRDMHVTFDERDWIVDFTKP